MPMIEVLEPLEAPWPTVTLSVAGVTHKCPVDGSVDSDTVEIAYSSAAGLIEAESWERYLEVYEQMAVTSEELAGMVWRDLLAVKITPSKVVVSGEHASRTFVVASLP